jgi:PucR-like helix-turn-helix protein
MATEIAERPWETLPPEVGAALREDLPELTEDIIDAISRGVPEYALPLEGPFGRNLRIGVEEALGQFASMIEDPGSDRGAGREVYINLGRGEVRAGRRLDALLSAYRLGARVAWRRLAAAGERAGLEPRVLYRLAEAIYAYIDELSADSIEGYAREQAAAAGALQRRRQHLAALLVQDPPATRSAVEAAAAEAAWTLPRSVAALAIDEADADRLVMRLGADALVTPIPPITAAIVADPEAPGRRREIEAALDGRAAAIGPAMPWPEAAISFRRAEKALRLTLDGTLDPVDSLMVADEHGLDLLLTADRRLARDFADRVLGPLAQETEASQARLGATLEAWLRHRGRTEEVARALHVHPQTVRYRLGRLRDLFENDLEDPDVRFELELALRARAAGLV